MFCKKCGQELLSGDKFCPNCGTEVNEGQTNQNSAYSDDLNNVINNVKNAKNATDSSPRSRTAALLLSLPFFFPIGMLGCHHFYVGNSSKGIAYLLCTLLLCWLIIPLIIIWILTLVDFIKIASGTFQDNEGKYLIKW